MSAARASPRPPPAAAPLTAARTGIRRRPDPRQRPGRQLLEPQELTSAHRREPADLVEVEAGTERLTSTGDDQHAELVLVTKQAREQEQLVEHPEAHRVQTVRPVQRGQEHPWSGLLEGHRLKLSGVDLDHRLFLNGGR